MDALSASLISASKLQTGHQFRVQLQCKPEMATKNTPENVAHQQSSSNPQMRI
jgi:hypothetical protein